VKSESGGAPSSSFVSMAWARVVLWINAAVVVGFAVAAWLNFVEDGPISATVGWAIAAVGFAVLLVLRLRLRRRPFKS
jgi:hypothetical protein